ncbi:MAG: hypothetical protein U0638_04915 [Phycisphaerales bacterium]
MKKLLGTLAAGLMAVTMVAGCGSSSRSSGGMIDPYRTDDSGRMVAKKEAPAPKKEAPAPKKEAPAPAPMAEPAMASSGNVLYYPTGRREGSGLMVEKIAPTEVTAGAPFDYQIKVTNIAGTTLSDVMVWDMLDQGFNYNSSNPSGAMDAASRTLKWGLGDLKAGEVKTITVNGSAAKVGTITSCASASYNLAVCQSIKVVQPALAIKKEAPAEVLICDAFPVKITVTNTGSGVARNVKVSDQLPAGLTTSDGKSTFESMVAMLGPGESKTFDVMVKADKTGAYKNMAKANAEGNLAADSNTTNTVVKQPVLTITKKGNERVVIGRPVNFTITVANTGDAAAADTVIKDPIPAGATFVSATEGGKVDGNAVVWNLGTLAPGASKTVNVSLNVAATANISNTATVSAKCASPASATAGTQVAGVPAILLEVVDDPDAVEVGGQVTYTIEVTNQGSAPGTNIKIVAQLEDFEQFISCGGATAGTSDGKTITFAPLPSLAPKAKTSWKVVVKGVKAGDTRFKVSMTSDQMTRPVEETESTNFYQ